MPILQFGQYASLIGLLADRPAPDPERIGRYYTATDEGITYRDSGTAWQPTSVAAAVGSDALSVVYVGKQGLDANDGLKIGESKLTIASAVTQAAALITAGAAKAVVRVMDSGTYTENVVLPDNVILRADAATLVGILTLDPGAEAYLDRHFPASGSTVMVDALEASGDTSHYSARVMDGRGMGGALTNVDLFRNASSGRVLMVDVGVGFVPQGGIGLRDQSAGGFGHIHFNCKDIYLAGNNAQAIRTNNANTNIIGYVDHILEFGTPTGTVALDLRDAGSIVKITASEIIADSAWVITAGALYINCPKITGTQTGTATIVNGQTPDVNAGLAAANAPTALNPFATMADAGGGTFDTIGAGAAIDWDSINFNLDIGTTTPGSYQGALMIPTGIANTYWSFGAISGVSVSPAYTHPVAWWGFNAAANGRAVNAALPTITWAIEGRYYDGANYVAEIYLQYTPKGGSGTFRPLSWTIAEESPYGMLINVSGTWNFTRIDTAGLNVNGGNLIIYGAGSYAIQGLDTTLVARNFIGFSGGDQINIGDGVHNAKFGYTVGVTRNLMVANADPMWDDGNGIGIISIKNAGTVPNANVSTGGLLYCEGGALKFRGSGGKVTTIADAA